MPDVEQTMRIHRAADAVFDVIADARIMSRYLPITSHAESPERDRVRVNGDGHGRHYAREGHLRRVDDRNRMEWGADERDDSGWIEARDRDDFQSGVTMPLPFANATWNEELREARGGKVEPRETRDERR